MESNEGNPAGTPGELNPEPERTVTEVLVAVTDRTLPLLGRAYEECPCCGATLVRVKLTQRRDA